MDDNSSLLTVFLPLGIVTIVFGFPIAAFVIFRVLAHRERMAMIAAGMAPGSTPPSAGSGAKIDRLYEAEPAQVTLNKGIRLAAIGAAITIGIAIASFHYNEDGVRWYPGPWLLLGLVPMFIGIAQVIIGVLSRANVPAAPGPAAVGGTAWIPPTPPPPPPQRFESDPFDIGPFTPQPQPPTPTPAPTPEP